MSTLSHHEKHFTSSEFIRDIVLGMSDGLTVPFALAAGLSGISVTSTIIVTAGLAELAAGAIAMGLGGYLAARTEAQHYAAELEREHRETVEVPEEEAREVAAIFTSWGLEEPHVQAVVAAIRQDRSRWVDFMMRFELGLEEPDPNRAWQSALLIGLSYVAGGLVPLHPYFFVHDTHRALAASIAVTAVALLIFGYVKGRYTSKTPFWIALQTLLVGSVAAAAAFGIARLIS